MPGKVKKKKYLFTSKKISTKALMSDILGVIALVSSLVAIYLAFLNEGQATRQCGSALFLSVLMAVAGIVLAILARKERDTYYVFSYLGMGINGLVIVLASFLLNCGL